jgi:hypothetical protein
MSTALTQTETLAVMTNCAALIDAASWEDTLQRFAERLSEVSDKLTVVEFARLVMIGAAISKKMTAESEVQGRTGKVVLLRTVLTP